MTIKASADGGINPYNALYGNSFYMGMNYSKTMESAKSTAKVLKAVSKEATSSIVADTITGISTYTATKSKGGSPKVASAATVSTLLVSHLTSLPDKILNLGEKASKAIDKVYSKVFSGTN